MKKVLYLLAIFSALKMLGPACAGASDPTLIVPVESATVGAEGASGVLGGVLHQQNVYGASQFPAGRMLIQQLRYRPHLGVTPFSTTVSNIQFRLSTTAAQPDGLNSVFAQNEGADEVLVFSGSLSISSACTGPAGGPLDFDIVVPLSTPFVYDPSKGNLLLDVRNYSGSPVGNVVDHGGGGADRASRAFSFGADAVTADFSGTGSDIMQLVYLPLPTCTPVPSGAVSWWKGESNALDSVDGNHGTLLNGASFVSGKVGQALSFDGVNDYVEVPSAANLKFSGAFSIETWMRLDAPAGPYAGDVIVSKGQDVEAAQDWTLSVSENGKLCPHVLAGGVWSFFDCNTLLSTGTWYHVAMVYDGTHLQGYVNGVLDGTVNVSGSVRTTDFPVRIGAYAPINGTLSKAFWRGAIDELSLYDRPLSAAELQSIYNSGVEGKCTSSPPVIVSQPLSQAVYVGDNVSFSVSAAGTPPLRYQWRLNGQPLSGRTNSSLTVTNVQVADEGNYSVVVSNAFNAVTSGNAALIVNQFPSPNLGLIVPVESATVGAEGASGVLNGVVHEQNVYGASQFPAGRMLIQQLRYRPHLGVTPFSTTVSNIQFRLSTTAAQPDGLNSVFAQNEGADEVLVFSGSLSISSACTGPAGGPLDFDIVIPLSTPFVYDPSKGNLLLDVRNYSGAPTGNLIDHGGGGADRASRAFSFGADAVTADFIGTGSDIMQIVYLPLPTCTPVPSGVVSWWRGESDALDSVDGNHGTLLNGASFASGEVGQALSFDGVNDYVEVPSAANLKFNGPFSIETWMRLDAPAGPYAGDVIVSKGQDVEAAQDWTLSVSENGKLCPHVFAGGVWSFFDCNTLLSTGTWYHVAMVYDGTHLQGYVNGVLDGTVNVSGSVRTTDYAVRIGAYAPINGTLSKAFWRGAIDELSLYSRALGSTEIAAIYNAGVAGKCPPAPPPPPCTPAPSGLVSWWKGETNALDSVDGNHGTLLNGTSFVSGEVGQALSFDGVNDYVEVPSAANLKFSGAFSIETWMRLDAPPGPYAGDVIVTKGQDMEAAQDWTLSVSENGKLRPHVNAGGGWYYFDCNTLLITGTWYHVAMVYDGTNLQGYVNGVLDGTVNVSGPVQTTDYPVRIGAYAPINGTLSKAFWRGAIDELSLYSRALGSTEIAAVYNAGVTGKCPPAPPCTPVPSGAVSWWKGESNALDSVDGNHGTLLNGTSFVSGQVGQALSFDGVNDYVEVPSAANLKFSGPFSIETWMRLDAPAGPYAGDVIVSKGQDVEAAQDWTLSVSENGKLCPHVLAGGVWSFFDCNTLLSTGTWYHVAMVYDGTHLQGYVNGVLDGTVNVSGPVRTTDYAVRIGAYAPINGTSSKAFWRGAIDELSLYGRALSAAEIQAIFNSSSEGKCTSAIPLIVTQPTDKIAIVGDTVTFNVAAIGAPPLRYQWRFNGDPLPGRTNSSLTLVNVQFSDQGNYSVIVSNFITSVTSSNAFLTVNPPPVCTLPPVDMISWWTFNNDVFDSRDSNNGATPAGSSFSAGKVGAAFNAIGRYVLVADSPSLRPTNALTIEAWVNPASFVSSTPRTIFAKSAAPTGPGPWLQTFSYFLGVTNNSKVLFAVSPDGTAAAGKAVQSSVNLPINQWSFVVATYDGAALRVFVNGVLSGETNYSGGIFPGTANCGIGAIPTGPTTLTWSFMGVLDEVTLYSRALSASEVQSIYNSGALGKCPLPPTIVRQPFSQAVPQGEDALFSVVATGTRPLRYQWRYMGQNIFRATNATLLIEKVQPTNQGFYTVVISNIAGSVLSADGGLKVLPPLNCTPAPADMISWWPADNTHADAVDGNNATANFPPIILNPFGPGKINQAFNLNGSGARLQVAGSPSLSFGSNANFTIEGWIKAFPTNGAPLQSQTYPNVPLIERRSSSGLAGVGFSLSLNQGRLAFWLATNTTVLTANSVMFISSGPDLRDGMFHHVAVSVNRTQTNSAVLCVDGNAVLTFDLSSRRGPLTNSTVGMMFIGGPTTTLSNSFFFGLIDELTMYSRALSAAEIQAIAGAGSAGKCRVPPSIVQQPADQTINSGAPASFSVVATGSPNLRFQWFRVGGSALPGATNATAILTGVTNTSQYFVRVTNFWGSVISSNATLTVLPPPPGVPANGTLQFDLNAGQPHLLFSGYPGQSYLVEASTNLIDWEVIGSATDLGNGSFEFFDPNWTNYNACFYRVVQP